MNVIATTPQLIVCFILAVAVLLVDVILYGIRKRSTGYILPLLSAALLTFVLIDGLYCGVQLKEMLLYVGGYAFVAIVCHLVQANGRDK